MPRPMTDKERKKFLAEPRIAVVSVDAGEGRPPLATPVWFAPTADGGLTFFTGTQGRPARKKRLIQKTGTVTLCIQNGELPYKYATAEGTVVKAEQPPKPDEMLAVVSRYMPAEAAQGFVQGELANPGPSLVQYTVRPDRWLSMDFSDIM